MSAHQEMLDKSPLDQGRPDMDESPPQTAPGSAAVGRPLVLCINQSVVYCPCHVNMTTFCMIMSSQDTKTQQSGTGPPPRRTPPCTADAALISENIDITDFLPRSPHPDSWRVDAALQEISSDLAETSTAPQQTDYDFSAPFSPFEDIAGQSSVQPRPRLGPAPQPDVIPNHPSSSHIPTGENVSEVQDSRPKSSLPPGPLAPEQIQSTPTAGVSGHPTQSSLPLVDGRGSPMDEQEKAPPPKGAGGVDVGSPVNPEHRQSNCGGTDPSEVCAQAQGDAGEDVLEGGPSSDAPGQLDARPDVEDVVSAPQSLLSNHVHPGDTAHTQASEVEARPPSVRVSDTDAPLPSAGVHGHSSDAHIKVGENVSEVVSPLPTRNIHGHASDSHIKVGEHVSEVASPLPSPSVHGHATDAHIRLGENVSDVVTLPPAPSVHGHASDAHFNVGEFVSNVSGSKPRWSKHGHASDCVLQPGCVVAGTEPALPPLPGSSYGHSSESTLAAGCVVSQEEPKHSPLPGSAHGHSSDSSLGIGCVVSKAEPPPSLLPGSSYGHSSHSTLGVGCVVLGAEPVPCPVPGSSYGHSSDSSLGAGCVVKGSGLQKQGANDQVKGIQQIFILDGLTSVRLEMCRNCSCFNITLPEHVWTYSGCYIYLRKT